MTRRELGVQAPAWHWEWEPAELADWARGVEAIGFDWLDLPDHLIYPYDLPDRPVPGPFRDAIPHHEALTTLAYLAGQTSGIGLQTSVLILPQRSALAVAKQAAQIDRLSGGRFRLGLGVGDAPAEYDALRQSFGERGARLEEGIGLLRACWTQEPVTFAGRWETLHGFSMLPKPVTPGGPPILIGAAAPVALDRAARLADGWIATGATPPERYAEIVADLRARRVPAGRDAAPFLCQASVRVNADTERLTGALRAYFDAGADRISLGLPGWRPDDRLDVDAYLRLLEAVWRDVWPALRDG